MSSDIQWHIQPQTWYSDEQASDLIKAIKALGGIESESDENRLKDYAYLLSQTTTITIDMKLARVPLQAFKAFLEGYHAGKFSPAQIWEYRKRQLPTKLLNAWHIAWQEGQDLFDPDPAELPTDALTGEQKAEAETPGSPLI